ncbi:HNH endonuclease [Bifidobacterium thermophilum]|uniref:HNH endonuclease n=2 Tax=Bifidobacterium thermophilum TaxID=33905 RepID=UPI0039933BD9
MLFAVITGMRPVHFPFKVFFPPARPRMKFLLAQQPFLHELIDKTILEVHSHWLSDRPVEPNLLLLEIDHIIPVARGGETVEDNLQTLCWKYNRAKSDKIIA